ncbi:hypothetical protein HK096_007978, partial [Nowakowskiella sp. JEL0078]
MDVTKVQSDQIKSDFFEILKENESLRQICHSTESEMTEKFNEFQKTIDNLNECLKNEQKQRAIKFQTVAEHTEIEKQRDIDIRKRLFDQICDFAAGEGHMKEIYTKFTSTEEIDWAEISEIFLLLQQETVKLSTHSSQFEKKSSEEFEKLKNQYIEEHSEMSSTITELKTQNSFVIMLTDEIEKIGLDNENILAQATELKSRINLLEKENSAFTQEYDSKLETLLSQIKEIEAENSNLKLQHSIDMSNLSNEIVETKNLWQQELHEKNKIFEFGEAAKLELITANGKITELSESLKKQSEELESSKSELKHEKNSLNEQVEKLSARVILLMDQLTSEESAHK